MRIFTRSALLAILMQTLLISSLHAQYNTSSQTIGSGANQLDIGVSVDAGLSQVKFVITGPATVWFGFSFNTTTMSPGSYTILANVSGGNPAEYIMVNHAAPTLQPVQNLTGITSSTAGGRKTYTFYRAISTGDINDYTFMTTTGSLDIAWAYGTTLSMGYHADRGGSSLNFINPCTTNPPVIIPTVSICAGDSALILGQYRHTPGSYSQTFPKPWACDSIVQQQLIVNQPVTTTLPTIHLCVGDSALIFGQYQHLSGNYSLTLTSAAQCDSIVFQPLSVSPGGTAFFDTTYMTVCIGDSIQIGNQWVFGPGSFTIFDTIAGCDSLYNHFVISQPVIDTTLLVIGMSMNAIPGYPTYHWIDCTTGTTAPGSTNSSVYTPMVMGSYRVEITVDGCTSSSGCQIAGPNSIESPASTSQQVNLFPNPVTNLLNVSMQEIFPEAVMRLYDMSGKELIRREMGGSQSIQVDVSHLAPGVYQLHISGQNLRIIEKVVVR
jgi:hypothetical protein